jgi:isopentenyldiphosphate isomerase|tara:strand:- start:21 stop:524 length:504 start_codon:yes stop_codon:yes gene_type:complete
MNPQNFTEIFDVVDEEDCVIGQASRKLVHEKGLTHRSIHVLVFDSKNRLFLQKRSLNKDENPEQWDTSASGHVDSGEDYDESAARELWEELGIRAKVSLWMKLKACEETLREHVGIFKCVSDEEMTLEPNEISDGKFFTLEEIENSIKNTPDLYTSTFRVIFDLLTR